LSGAVLLDISVTCDVNLSLGCDVIASSNNVSVRVVVFGFERVLLNVFEGPTGETTVATIASEGSTITVNELLLRVGDESASLDHVDTFNGTSGGEGPA